MEILAERIRHRENDAAEAIMKYLSGYGFRKVKCSFEFKNIIYKPFYCFSVSLKKRSITGKVQDKREFMLVDGLKGNVMQRIDFHPNQLEIVTPIKDAEIIQPEISTEMAYQKANQHTVRIQIRKKAQTDLLPEVELFYKPLTVVNVGGLKTERTAVYDLSSGNFLID